MLVVMGDGIRKGFFLITKKITQNGTITQKWNLKGGLGVHQANGR